MEFDDQMRRFFGTDDLGAVSPEGLASGIEHMRVEFGLETDKGRRFAMWSLLYMLGSGPDLDVAFKDPRARLHSEAAFECGDEVEESGVVSGEFVVSGCDASEVLDLVEEAFDEISVFVERGVEASPFGGYGPARDDGRRA